MHVSEEKKIIFTRIFGEKPKGIKGMTARAHEYLHITSWRKKEEHRLKKYESSPAQE